jgi:hypothetical protein
MGTKAVLNTSVSEYTINCGPTANDPLLLIGET